MLAPKIKQSENVFWKRVFERIGDRVSLKRNGQHQWLHVTIFALCTWHTAEWIELTLQQRDMGTVYDWWKISCMEVISIHVYINIRTHIHVFFAVSEQYTERQIGLKKKMVFHHRSCGVSRKRWQNALKSSTISAYFFHLLAAIFGCCSLGLSNGFDQNVKHLQTLKWLPKPSQSHNFWHKF